MASTASKSPQKVKNVVLALLALWSIISLVVIVVWATSPDLKSSAQCRAELQELTANLEGSKVICDKNKKALEEMVMTGREKQEEQRAEILQLLGRLNATNVTLEECLQEKVILNGNISVLLENIELLRQTETNLTAQLHLQEEVIEALEQNVTQTLHENTACVSHTEAAKSQREAALSETRACQSKQQYLKKQLDKCKLVEVPQQPQQQDTVSGPPPRGAAAPPLSIHLLTLLVCSALRLITCE